MSNTNQSLSSQLLLTACIDVKKYVLKIVKNQAKKQRKRINKLTFIVKGHGIKS